MTDSTGATSGTESTSDQFREAARTAGAATEQAAGQIRDSFQENVVEPARRAAEAAQASTQRFAEDGSALGTRMIDQAEANAREAFAAMRAAAQAKDPAEVMRIQGDYLREQGQRSMAQAREVGELIARFGREAMAGFDPTGGGAKRS